MKRQRRYCNELCDKKSAEKGDRVVSGDHRFAEPRRLRLKAWGARVSGLAPGAGKSAGPCGQHRPSSQALFSCSYASRAPTSPSTLVHLAAMHMAVLPFGLFFQKARATTRLPEKLPVRQANSAVPRCPPIACPVEKSKKTAPYNFRRGPSMSLWWTCVCRGTPVLAEDQYSDSIRRLGEAERKAEEQSDFTEKLLRNLHEIN